jgi:putative addiction module killer protein
METAQMLSRKIKYYLTEQGKSPFLDWVNALDINTQVIVDRLIQRVSQGGAKKSIRCLKEGVFEIKIPHASGLRVYFAEEGQNILLLKGGDKKTQVRDIRAAKIYWRNYGQ